VHLPTGQATASHAADIETVRTHHIYQRLGITDQERRDGRKTKVVRGGSKDNANRHWKSVSPPWARHVLWVRCSLPAQGKSFDCPPLHSLESATVRSKLISILPLVGLMLTVFIFVFPDGLQEDEDAALQAKSVVMDVMNVRARSIPAPRVDYRGIISSPLSLAEKASESPFCARQSSTLESISTCVLLR
jgi:hypothetical protein